MQLIFGIGALWGTRSDAAGVGPDQFAILQENSVDFSFEIKELYSQLAFPVDIARAKGKVTGKAKMARVFGALYADLFFGTVSYPGSITAAQDEDAIIPTLTPFQVTVANAGNFVEDLGVYQGVGNNSGFRYTLVTTPTNGGEYSVSNGVYTFQSINASAAVKISYLHSSSAGKSLDITNNFMGFTPTFTGTFYQNRSTQGAAGTLTLRLNECVSSHLTFPSRLDDYGIPDFDWMAFANQNNIIGTLSTSE